MHCWKSYPHIASREVVNLGLNRLGVTLTIIPYHMNGACARTDSPSFFYLASCLFNLSYECCLISTQNCCHMDL
jgi:hypothetical protein